MVGMSVHQTHCVVTRKGEHPQPHPRPVQQRFANKVRRGRWMCILTIMIILLIYNYNYVTL